MSEPESRKKLLPGRPRKKPIAPIVPLLGVMGVPHNPENRMEFVFQTPILFKKFAVMLRSMNIPEIYFQFEADCIRIELRDQHKTLKLFTVIDCTKVARYYCQSPITIGVKREQFEQVFHYFDKTFLSVIFYLKNANCRSIMYVRSEVKDSTVEYNEIHTLNLINNRNDTEIPEPVSDDNYPIKFVLPTVHLKKRVASMTGDKACLTIDKVHDEPLSIGYSQSRKTGKKSTYPNEANLQLHCALKNDDIFSTSVSIQPIRPFISSIIADQIQISADITRMLMLKFQTEALTIRLFINPIQIEL